MSLFSVINDATGFANGDKFETADQVREYFCRDTLEALFWQANSEEQNALPSQDTLDAWAEIVIENRWWLTPEEEPAATLSRPDLAHATWAIVDAKEVALGIDPERAVFERGFPTREAAKARLPHVLATMASLGFDLSLENGDLAIVPEWAGESEALPESQAARGPFDITDTPELLGAFLQDHNPCLHWRVAARYAALFLDTASHDGEAARKIISQALALED